MTIKEIRKKQHITQKQLAEKIGVDISVISRYENGTITPPLKRLESIAKVLDVPIDALLQNNLQTEIEISNQVNINHTDRIISYAMKLGRLQVYNRGICELCGQPAPFLDKEGQPYLEAHQIQDLSNDALPLPDNIVLLCPNCHRKIQVLNDPDDINKLKEIAKKHNM